MKHIATILSLSLSLIAFSQRAFGWSGGMEQLQRCEEKEFYTNGNKLKDGNTLYYQDGKVLAENPTPATDATVLYYPSGNVLRKNDILYYNSGKNLGKISDLAMDFFLPNGTPFSFGAVAAQLGEGVASPGGQTINNLSWTDDQPADFTIAFALAFSERGQLENPGYYKVLVDLGGTRAFTFDSYPKDSEYAECYIGRKD